MVARFDTKFMALYQSVTQSEKKAHGNDIDSRNLIINDGLVDHVVINQSARAVIFCVIQFVSGIHIVADILHVGN